MGVRDDLGVYERHLAQTYERIEAAGASAPPMSSPLAGAPVALIAAIESRLDRIGADLVDLSLDLHAHPETAFAEHHAVAAVASLLARHGIEAEVGAYGLPTAVRARIGRRRPRVAILAEYDALPDLGHACGHNVICASAVGACLLAAHVAADIGGSVELIGTPGEEGGGGKVRILEAGGFDEIDAAIMLHPAGFDVAAHPWLGMRQVEVAFHGKPAHASMSPFLGRNALDAAVSAYSGIGQLRQHMLPSDRVHGVIREGGRWPSVVPERTESAYYVRSAEAETLAALSARVERVLRGAAEATGTAAEVRWDPVPTYLPVRNNLAIAGRYADHMARRGRRVLPPGIVPTELAASTDFGNVSQVVAGIHPTLGIAPASVMIHEAEFARWAASRRAARGVLDGAFALAGVAVDVLCDQATRAAAEAEFAGGGPGRT